MANLLVLEHKISVTPKKTKYLTSGPIQLDFTGIIDDEGVKSDAKTVKAIQKEFSKLMKKQLATQLHAMNSFLQQKDKLIEGLIKERDQIEKLALATATVAQVEKHKANLKKAHAAAKQIDSLQADYQEIVAGWVKNTPEQQGLICMDLAVANVAKQKVAAKNRRVRLGQVLKVTLVVAAIALTVAAIVLTAGAAAPAFLALAIVGASLTTIGSVGGLAKDIHANANIEKKILKSAQAEVKKIADAFKPMAAANSAIAKHIGELQDVMKKRQSEMGPLEMKIKKMEVDVKVYQKNLGQLTHIKDQAKQVKKIAGVKDQVAIIKARLVGMKNANAEGQALLQELHDMNVNLSKLERGAASTIGDHIKKRFTTVDGLLTLSNDLGGLAGGVSGLDPS